MTRWVLLGVVAVGAFAYASYERFVVYEVRGVEPGVWDLLVDVGANPFMLAYVVSGSWLVLINLRLQQWSLEVAVVRYRSMSRFVALTVVRSFRESWLLIVAIVVGICGASIGLAPLAIAPSGTSLSRLRELGLTPIAALTLVLCVTAISLTAVAVVLIASWLTLRSVATQLAVTISLWLWILLSAATVFPTFASFTPTTLYSFRGLSELVVPCLAGIALVVVLAIALPRLRSRRPSEG